jgi:uncharacterized protein YeeX (DUF496 family)
MGIYKGATMNYNDLNNSRLSLSSIYNNNKMEYIRQLEARILSLLTWPQYIKMQQSMTKHITVLATMSEDQFSSITKSIKVRALHADLRYAYNQMLEVSGEYDQVLKELESVQAA